MRGKNGAAKSGRICYNRCKMTMLIWLFILQTACGSGGSVVGVTSFLAPVAPGIASVTPVNGAEQVAVSATISAGFTSEIDPATLNGETFQTSGPDGRISGTLTYDPVTKIATFTPNVPLAPLAMYAVTITAGVKDKSGKPVSTGYNWGFKTGRDFLVRANTEIIPATLFGMFIHWADSTTAWPVVPFKTWLLWDAEVGWPWLEPTKGVWYFDKLDKYIALAEANNVEVVLPLGLCPTWASARPTESSPYHIPGSAAEPANFNDWKDYVRVVATRYKGRIHYYEIWNEVNITNFYSGTADQMIELAKEAIIILKEIDPTIKVITPSCTGIGLAWFDDYLSKGGANYADIIGYHFYVSPNAPEATLDLKTKVSNIMAKYNVTTKPLWNTEAGWYIANNYSVVQPGTGGFSKVLTTDEAAAYVGREYILNWAIGIDRFYWYSWDSKFMGLIEADGVTLKAPAIAYGQIYNWLNGARMASCGKNNDGTWVVKIIQPSGRSAWIAWNPDKTVSLTIPKEWGTRQMKDLSGGAIDISNQSTVSISPSPLLFTN